MDETMRRRQAQELYNQEHHIIPKQIEKKIVDVMEAAITDTNVFRAPQESRQRPISRKAWEMKQHKTLNPHELSKTISKLQEQMVKLAQELKFEEAAQIRDEIAALQQQLIMLPSNDNLDL